MGINKWQKWLYGAIPALLIHLSAGMVYIWSIFVNPISEYINKTPQQVQFSFSFAICFLGLSAAFGGKFVEKNIKKSTLLGLIFFCSGLLLTGLSVYLKSLIGIYISFGFIMGIGLGISYISPIKSLMLWFKDNKGLGTGIAVCAFGFASAIASPLSTMLMSKFPLYFVFVLLGLIYIIPMFVAYKIIKKPDWHKEDISNTDFKSIKMFKDKKFVAIWFIMFINISCGLSLISIASPLMKEIKVSPILITTTIAIMGICNGVGRLLFSSFSDKLNNRIYIYISIFSLSIICIVATLMFKNILIVMALLFAISSVYGAGFSCLPPLLSDSFGMKNISKIHGITLTAWSLAGLIGNQLSSLIQRITGNYLTVLYVILPLYLIGLIISIVFLKNNKRFN